MNLTQVTHSKYLTSGMNLTQVTHSKYLTSGMNLTQVTHSKYIPDVRYLLVVAAVGNIVSTCWSVASSNI
jgi:hypothetical protein